MIIGHSKALAVFSWEMQPWVHPATYCLEMGCKSWGEIHAERIRLQHGTIKTFSQLAFQTSGCYLKKYKK